MSFEKGDVISIENKPYQCYLAGEGLAVFFRLLFDNKKNVVDRADVKVCFYDDLNSFEYRECIGVCNICQRFMFDGETYHVMFAEVGQGVEEEVIIHTECPK